VAGSSARPRISAQSRSCSNVSQGEVPRNGFACGPSGSWPKRAMGSNRVAADEVGQVAADDNVFWRTSLRDGIYSLASNLLVSGNGNLERYVGSQPSVGGYL